MELQLQGLHRQKRKTPEDNFRLPNVKLNAMMIFRTRFRMSEDKNE